MAEKEIKIKVIEYLLKKKEHDIVVPEITVGHKSKEHSQVRADIFAVNGDISIYEIKSEKDSLVRLENQLENYMAYANRVNVVVADKFLNKLNIDASIGIYTITANGIIEVREAIPRDVEKENVLDYWLSNELKDFLSGYRGVSKLSKNNLKLYIRSLLNEKQIYNATLNMLKERYLEESKDIKKSILNESLEKFPKRGLKINTNVTPLRELPFKILTP